MAKKSIAEAAQESAARSREMNKKYGVPGQIVKKPKVAEPMESKESLSSSFHKQMGTSRPKGGDVNLPISTAPSHIKTGFGQMSDKEVSMMRNAGKKLKRY